MIEIVSICGSLRKGSYNRIVMESLQALAPDGMRIREAPSYRRLPPYDWDVQQSTGFPAAVTELADSVRAADGVIFVTPEYNFSIPGSLKNAIDWVSRLDGRTWRRAGSIRSASLPGLPGCAYTQQAGDLHRPLRGEN